MGLNAYFAFGVVLGMKFTWQVALGCVFISGVIFLILSVLPVREWIVNAIPKSLKMAIAPASLSWADRPAGGQDRGHHPRRQRRREPARRPRSAVPDFRHGRSTLAQPGAIIIAILGPRRPHALGNSEFNGIFSRPAWPRPSGGLAGALTSA
jgi:AGZA family xanthine/uracil permease-like MFS transporter